MWFLESLLQTFERKGHHFVPDSRTIPLKGCGFFDRPRLMSQTFVGSGRGQQWWHVQHQLSEVGGCHMDRLDWLRITMGCRY